MAEAQETQTNANPEFQIQRIYVKDVSFEVPNAPQVFQLEWQPDINLDMDSKTVELAENVFEVTLSLTVTAKLGEETAFLCEVHQAGVFTLPNLEGIEQAHCLGAFCPNILFPYAREAISNLVNRGTFPPLNLTPVNFDALFQNYLDQQQSEQPTSVQ